MEALECAPLDPVGRNTAPALTLDELAAMTDGTDPVLVVTSADEMVVNAGEPSLPPCNEQWLRLHTALSSSGMWHRKSKRQVMATSKSAKMKRMLAYTLSAVG